jgi:8-oxo-dGTP pyrophosphatase MutT (NUDIX family)
MHQELQELALRFGKPLEVTRSLGANSFLASRKTHIAEVCLAVKRANGRLLTMTKAFYPSGIYRLPTGSIGLSEPVAEALQREIWEETGLEMEILRFLAHITYLHNEGRIFHSYIFLLASEGQPAPQDHSEQISGFYEVSTSDLLQIAQTLQNLPPEYSGELGATWSDWGKFRAVVHQVTAEALAQR